MLLAGLPQEEPGFTHSDFKADHVLVTPQGLALIDFDTCSLADPALDVGKFLADLDYWFANFGRDGAGGGPGAVPGGICGERSGRTGRARLAGRPAGPSARLPRAGAAQDHSPAGADF